METEGSGSSSPAPVVTFAEGQLDEKTQKEIIAGLLSMQPSASKTDVGRSPLALMESTMAKIKQMSGFESHSILKAIHTFQQQNPLFFESAFQVFTPVGPTPVVVPQEEEPTSSNSSTPNSSATANSETPSTGVEHKVKVVREKVYADGYIMSYDKRSTCQTKYFWRCERKQECNARVHTDIKSREILRTVTPHNHAPPSQEELEVYELDFSSMIPNFVYPIKNINRYQMQRKLNIRAAKRLNSPGALGIEIGAGVADAHNFQQGSTGRHAQKRSAGKDDHRGEMKSKKEVSNLETDLMMAQEEFRKTFELTRRIIQLIQPTNNIEVARTSNENDLLMFVAKNCGDEENVYFPIVLHEKNEISLQSALEALVGKRCEGNLVISYSDKVYVKVHDAIVNDWTHGKLFQLNTDRSHLWRLIPVNSDGKVLNST